MSVWFEAEGEIDCSLEQVKQAVENAGEYFTGVVSLMPGLSSVDLVEQHAESVTIRTNEGLMRRTNVSTRIEADSVVMEFDEEYKAGSKVTTNSHFSDQFVASDHGARHRLVISDVAARGLLGFFYRRFGSSNIGTALMAAHKAHLETSNA